MNQLFHSSPLRNANQALNYESGSLKVYLLSLLLLLRGLTLAITLIALLTNDPVLIGIAGGMMFSSFALGSGLKSRGHLRPSTIVAATFALQFAFTNAIAMSAYNKPSESRYLIYAHPEFFFTASLIGLAGGLALWLGIALTEQRRISMNSSAGLLQVRLIVPERMTRPIILAVLIASIILNAFAPIEKLGILRDIVSLLPFLTVFLWARLLDLKERSAWIFLYVMITGLAAHAFFFSFLRISMIMPVVFAALGLLFAHGLKFLASVRIVPLAFLLILFASVFTVFGDIRHSASVGVERYYIIRDKLQEEEEEDDHFTLIGRISTVNQLTQVVRLTDENGFYGGATLDYLTYVFIPRFLWADKPIIAKGQWFAAEIGQGSWLESGLFSNSINMTIPGEFYLNFGWIGTILGCFVVGAILGLIHRAVASGGPNDLVGGAILAYVFWISTTLGADLQIMVTLLGMYLLFVAISFALHVLKEFGRPPQAPPISVLSHPS